MEGGDSRRKASPVAWARSSLDQQRCSVEQDWFFDESNETDKPVAILITTKKRRQRSPILMMEDGTTEFTYTERLKEDYLNSFG